ncbi:MAG: hypothetical protein ACRD6N_12110 [Pyrinomonadaceae bacterium]
MAYSSLTENEMRVVLEAREQSRREAEDLDRLKQKLREAFLLNENICANEFNRRWPEIYSEALRLRAYREGLT